MALNLSVRSDYQCASDTLADSRAQKPKNFLAFFSRLLPPPLHREAEKEMERKFLVLLRHQYHSYIINHDGIFHNRLYHVNISMVDKYRVKYQNFIKRLREARLEAGLTQVEAGKCLKKPQAYISKIERGERRVDVVELGEFAKLYSKPLEDFLK